jgi:DNA repair exonuclease SbcCD ATPase subunit
MTNNKVNITGNSKVSIIWNVLPMDYSREGENAIISKFAIKYGIPKENIKIEAKFISKNEKNETIPFSNDIITNINDTVFQQNLFKKYIEEKGITDYDFNKIAEIDGFINNYIDYDKYDKNKRYTIKWLKWDNFMSYGEGNFIDFTNLNKLVLLSSTPANQGGKTTFSIDLIRFLLFGKVTSREDNWTLAKVFNKHIPEATQVNVEGCISIDGIDYIINRKVTRPALDKRTDKSKVSHKVSYYKVIDNQYVNLADEDNLEETTTTLTNKAIKEAIGNERDFDLMISVNSDNLKGLISLKETDRGRLLSRWIGLLPLEEKDKIAREYFNKSVTPKLLLNRYNIDELVKNNEELGLANVEIEANFKTLSKKLEDTISKIKELKNNRDVLLQSKQQVDPSLLKIDVKTIENKLKQIADAGIIKKNEKENNEKLLSEIGEISFNENEYNELIELEKKLSIKKNTLEININTLNKEVKNLASAEYCITCGAKLKDVDNTLIIKEKNKLIESLSKEIVDITIRISETINKRVNLETNRKLYNDKCRLELIIQKNEVDIDNLRKDYREYNRTLKDIEANKTAIENNNRIENAINISNVNISTEEQIRINIEKNINDSNSQLQLNNKTINSNNEIINRLQEEEIIVKNWRIYLELIGKNGISKIVLKNTLPLINSELSQLLNNVCDFTVEVLIDERQDVMFNLIHDGVKSNLASGSGFEQTVASLALRCVLSKISTFSKPSFVVFDEILGGVSDENYDNIKMLYDKMILEYGTILEITHNKNIHDWHDYCLLISKKNNISKISML